MICCLFSFDFILSASLLSASSGGVLGGAQRRSFHGHTIPLNHATCLLVKLPLRLMMVEHLQHLERVIS